MVASSAIAADSVTRAWAALRDVVDPEIPVLSVVDLGLIRRLDFGDDGTLEVDLAPTYSGCPAMAVIRGAVEAALRAAGLGPVIIKEVLAPAWSSDWLSAEGRQKLLRYGIAPPVKAVDTPRGIWRAPTIVRCPRCDSASTEELSHFGSTPCKALYRCQGCLEPFEHFKCI
jgi:ring-1,2-phenylacetyl-CoA epoxidase subunit PaaD